MHESPHHHRTAFYDYCIAIGLMRRMTRPMEVDVIDEETGKPTGETKLVRPVWAKANDPPDHWWKPRPRLQAAMCIMRGDEPWFDIELKRSRGSGFPEKRLIYKRVLRCIELRQELRSQGRRIGPTAT